MLVFSLKPKTRLSSILLSGTPDLATRTDSVQHTLNKTEYLLLQESEQSLDQNTRIRQCSIIAQVDGEEKHEMDNGKKNCLPLNIFIN